MFAQILFMMVMPVWGWSSPHHEQAFLSTEAHAVPSEGPGMQVAPISTTMKCVVSLTLQYITIFVALGVCRTYLDFQGQTYESSAVQKALKHASETMFYAPMACVLFVGFRMRVVQLTQGKGHPQEFAQIGMYCVTYSILANTLMVLVVPIFTRFASSDTIDLETDPDTGELKTDGKNPFENKMLAVLFTCIRYACFLALYAGFAVVVYGLFTFDSSKSVSPAVWCTCILSCSFFLCYMFLAFARTYSQFSGQNTSSFEKVMLNAADTLAMAPMFCVLFLGARMRALQMDPVDGNPQPWAQNCFYACTWCLLTQTILAAVVPLCLSGKVKKGPVEGDTEFEIEGQPTIAKILSVGRWIIMVFLYAGATAVVCSVFTIQHEDGKESTPAVSPTMHCVMNFAFQYFFIYLLLWVVYTVEQLSGWNGLAYIKDAVESAKGTVQFAPMLCVLFIATRMRALQITDNQGAPQKYVQDGMYLATWAVMIQFMMCLIMPVLTGRKYEADSLDGAKKVQGNVQNYYGALAISTIRWLGVVCMLGGMVTVITGVFLMTPENANGRGSIRSHIPVVGEHLPPVPEPTSPKDVPLAEDVMAATGKGVGSGVNVVDDAGTAVTDAGAAAGEAVTG